MPSKPGVMWIAASVVLVTSACHPIQKPVETMADEPKATSAALRSMVDNGRAHNLAIADVHFVPHSSEISGLGEAALERFMPWLETYGGTLRYETYLTDEKLIVRRIAHVREYLALVGCDVDRIHITAMISGGRMITATEAIKIMNTETGAAAADPAAALGGASASSR